MSRAPWACWAEPRVCPLMSLSQAWLANQRAVLSRASSLYVHVAPLMKSEVVSTQATITLDLGAVVAVIQVTRDKLL